jgi:hypothetical protein
MFILRSRQYNIVFIDTSRKFIAGVIDTRGKFNAGGTLINVDIINDETPASHGQFDAGINDNEGVPCGANVF